MLDELANELGHFVRVDLAGLMVTKNLINFLVLLLKVRVRHAFDLVTSEEGAHELLSDITLQNAAVVFVHGQE